MDTRAQSIGISRYILALVVGAVLIWIVQLVTDPILSGAENSTNNAQANQATTWFTQLVDFLPVAFVLISTTGIIIYAVFIREVGR